jgi:hypothetical protein
VSRGHLARIHAGALRIVHDRHERPDLIDREIELPTATDERYAPYIVAAVHALPAVRRGARGSNPICS